ncbi:MAG: hypothetical protein WB810_02090 [Candidatus Cybelea sp.]
MRFSLLCASSALAASLILSACSSGSMSQSIPGGSQSAMGHHAGTPMIQLKGGVIANASCPSSYYECVTVSKSSPLQQQWCIVYSGTSDCSDLYPGTWTWAAPVSKARHHHKKGKVVSKFSPNPGNPTELTLSIKGRLRSSHGNVARVANLTACNSADSCVGPVAIGIIIQ